MNLMAFVLFSSSSTTPTNREKKNPKIAQLKRSEFFIIKGLIAYWIT